MTQSDPVATFLSERGAAAATNDPMAALCNVATLAADGSAEARTLVLREVRGQPALFVNGTSFKWAQLQQTAFITTYWPSTKLQYRIRAHSSEIPAAEIAESWALRPDAPKRMDWFYQEVATQSSPIDSRAQLLTQLESMALEEPLGAPTEARGILLQPFQIERLDLTQANGVHDRVMHTLTTEAVWRTQTLVP